LTHVRLRTGKGYLRGGVPAAFADGQYGAVPVNFGSERKLPSASVQPQPAAASVSPGVAQSASMDSSAGAEPVTATAAPTSGSLPLGTSTRRLPSTVFVSASALPAPKAASSSTAVRVKAGSLNRFFILRWSFPVRCVAGRPEPAVRGSAAGHARIDH